MTQSLAMSDEKLLYPPSSNPEVKLRYPVNALVSFHYFKDRDIADMKRWGLRLIGDSGAYSAASQGAPINIQEFAEWGARWKDNLAWVASLDVIGDKEASWTNYAWLRNQGLDVIPTIHYGCDPKEVDRYVAEGVDFIGLGGMVGRKSEADRLLRWTLSVFRYARDKHPQLRFHGWGVTHRQLTMNLPWYSVDSSGFSSAYRFARLSLFDPAKGMMTNIELDGKQIYKHVDLLKRVYNCDPDDVKISTPDRRRQLVRLAISSVQKLEEFLRNRHQVTPPTYGVKGWDLAPQVHVALGFPGAQSTLAVSPTDTPAPFAGPNVHNAMASGTDVDFFDPAGPAVHAAMRTDEVKVIKPTGTSVHFVDGYEEHLKLVAPLGPSVHLADSGWDNYRNAKQKEEE